MYIQKSGNNSLIFFKIRVITHYSFKYSRFLYIHEITYISMFPCIYILKIELNLFVDLEFLKEALF